VTFAIASAAACGAGSATSQVCSNPLWNGTSTPAGAMLFAWGVASGASTITGPSGFTPVTAASGQNTATQLFTKVSDGTEGSSFSIALGTSRVPGLAVAGVTGFNSLGAFDPIPSSSGNMLALQGTTWTSNDFTTTLNGDQLLLFMLVRSATTPPAAITIPSGYNLELAQVNSTGASASVGLAVASLIQTTAGDAGPPSGAFGVIADGGACLVSLAAALAAGGSAPQTFVSPSAAAMQAATW
jgi:hypothetical protein